MPEPKQKVSAQPPDALFGRVAAILDQARGNVVRAVNTQMVLAYRLIGREIIEALQGGEERAEYGRQVLETLSSGLTQRYGKGYSATNLKYFRLFYQAYPDRLAIRHPAGDESVAPENLHSPGGDLVKTPKSHPPGSQLPQAFSPQLTGRTTVP